MSRLRATLSPTETDRQIQTALDKAAREIESALAMVASAPVPRHHTRKTAGDLRLALESVQTVRYLGTPPTLTEPYADWRARQDQKDLERRERRTVKEQVDV